MNIEAEDNIKGQIHTNGNIVVAEQKDKGDDINNVKGLDFKVEYQISIINQIIKELEKEDIEGKVDNKNPVT